MGRVHDANLYAIPTSTNLILRYIALKPEMSFGVEHHVRDSLNTRYPRFQYFLFGFHERTEYLPAFSKGVFSTVYCHPMAKFTIQSAGFTT
jgi:hypothetical protein